MRALLKALPLLLLASVAWAKPKAPAPASPAKVEWLPFEAAVERAIETGRLVLVYNGWEREGT